MASEKPFDYRCLYDLVSIFFHTGPNLLDSCLSITLVLAYDVNASLPSLISIACLADYSVL
jgi:hypothetical protein